MKAGPFAATTTGSNARVVAEVLHYAGEHCPELRGERVAMVGSVEPHDGHGAEALNRDRGSCIHVGSVASAPTYLCRPSSRRSSESTLNHDRPSSPHAFHSALVTSRVSTRSRAVMIERPPVSSTSVAAARNAGRYNGARDLLPSSVDGHDGITFECEQCTQGLGDARRDGRRPPGPPFGRDGAHHRLEAGERPSGVPPSVRDGGVPPGASVRPTTTTSPTGATALITTSSIVDEPIGVIALSNPMRVLSPPASTATIG